MCKRQVFFSSESVFWQAHPVEWHNFLVCCANVSHRKWAKKHIKQQQCPLSPPQILGCFRLGTFDNLALLSTLYVYRMIGGRSHCKFTVRSGEFIKVIHRWKQPCRDWNSQLVDSNFYFCLLTTQSGSQNPSHGGDDENHSREGAVTDGSWPCSTCTGVIAPLPASLGASASAQMVMGV